MDSVLRRVAERGELWGSRSVYNRFLRGCERGPFLRAPFVPRPFRPRTLAVIEMFLVVNWLPHTVFVGFRCLLHSPSASID